jgi:hypothetical protein
MIARWTHALCAALLTLCLARPAVAQLAGGEVAPDPGLVSALSGFYAALQAGDTKAAGKWLTPEFFYIGPWGALEFRDETLSRYRQALDSGTLRDYRADVRALHAGSAGEGALWFRAIVREK